MKTMMVTMMMKTMMVTMTMLLQCCMIRSSTVAMLLSYHTGPRPLSDALRRYFVIKIIVLIIVIKIIVLIVVIKNIVLIIVIKIIVLIIVIKIIVLIIVIKILTIVIVQVSIRGSCQPCST